MLVEFASLTIIHSVSVHRKEQTFQFFTDFRIYGDNSTKKESSVQDRDKDKTSRMFQTFLINNNY